MITAHDAKTKADDQFWSRTNADKFIDSAIAYSETSCNIRFTKEFMSPSIWSDRLHRWRPSAENLVNDFNEKKIARFVSLAKSLGYKTEVRQADKWTLVKLSW